METLGKTALPAVNQARAAILRNSHSNALAPPVSTTSAPRYFVQWTDTELRKLFSTWKPKVGRQAIWRELEPAERTALTERATELRATLWPYVAGERNEVEASIAAMFSGFRSMRQDGSAAEGTVTVTALVLREFPAWAIARACVKISKNEAGLDPKWPPNDVQIHALVSAIVKEYQATLANVEALLAAPVETREVLPAPSIAPRNDVRPVGAEPRAPLIERAPSDGQHAQRVAADIAARKAQAAESKAGMA